ncbi:MAG: nucleoside phosphorylase [Candidatus Bipolaricaulota bacterium]|nr:nucleoside phosphorylase [Candidatus Bipolaricaulota bacterium]
MRLPTLLLSSGQLPQFVLLPGDPARAAHIAEHLDQPEALAKNREFHSYRGFYRGVPVGVVSTGVGSPGATICAEESIRAGALVLLRVGTSGSLQDDVTDGALVVATGAVRGDGTSQQLLPAEYPAVADPEVVNALWRAANTQGTHVHRGVVVTYDAFYRGVLDLRFGILSQAGALCVEMECAAIFCVAALRGVQAGAILAIDGDARRAAAGKYDPHREIVNRAISHEIEAALEAVFHLATGN